MTLGGPVQTPVHPIQPHLILHFAGIHLFDYCGRPVCIVEVCGVVVRLERREKFSAYTGINFC